MIVIISRPKIYGNDTVSMETMISKELNNEQTIDVFDTVIVGDYKLAGYLMGKTQISFTEFKKNDKDNYELVKVINPNKTIPRALDIVVAYHSQIIKKEDTLTQYLVVMSLNPNLAEIELITDNKELQRINVDTNPSISVLKFPSFYSEGEYTFYDNTGNIIK